MNRLIVGLVAAVLISPIGSGTEPRPGAVQVVLAGNDAGTVGDLKSFCPGVYQSADGALCVPKSPACQTGLVLLESMLAMQLKAAATNAANYMTVTDAEFKLNRPYRRRIVTISNGRPQVVEDASPFPTVYYPGSTHLPGKMACSRCQTSTRQPNRSNTCRQLVRYKAVCRLRHELNPSQVEAPPPAFPSEQKQPKGGQVWLP